MRDFTFATVSAPTAPMATTTRPTGANAAHCRSEAIRPVASPDAAAVVTIPVYDGAASDFPLIPGYQCAECGARRPGAGVNRQSQAMVTTPGGITVRRGGKCRTCRRVALAAQQAFQTTTARYMQQHGAGLDYQARKAVLEDALRDARLAMWRVYVNVAQRAAAKAADRRAA